MRILYPHLRDEERTRAYNPYVKSFMYTQHSVGLCNYAVRRSASLYQLVTQVQRSPSFSRLEQAVLWTVCYTSSIICYRLQYDILLFGDRCTRVKNSPKVVTQSATRHLHSLPLLPHSTIPCDDDDDDDDTFVEMMSSPNNKRLPAKIALPVDFCGRQG